MEEPKVEQLTKAEPFRSQAPRQTEILVGLRAIKETFGVGAKEVKAWVSMGAPIDFDGSVYRAEKWELWEWKRLAGRG